MENCRNCQRPLEPGYEYCHQCGTPIQDEGGEPASNMVSAVQAALGKADEVGESLQGLGRQVKSRSDAALGGQTSLRRRAAFSLVTSGTLLLIAGNLPITPTGLIGLLEAWLLLSLLLIGPISYWTVGAIPFSGLVHRILGDTLSLRRRLILALLATLLVWPIPAFFLFIVGAIAHENSPHWVYSPLLTLVGIFPLMYYCFGYSTNWRSIAELGHSITFGGMANRIEEVQEKIVAVIREQSPEQLSIEIFEMAKLRELTAGESSGTRGQQIVAISGRARIVIFVQDFGESLFLRWTVFYDASGRRILLVLGILYTMIEQFGMRWFGGGLIEYAQQISDAMSPVSKHQAVLETQGTDPMARAFGLQLGLSEYSWNELLAFENLVQDSLVSVFASTVASHQEESEIRDMMRSQMQREGVAFSGNHPLTHSTAL